MQLVRDLKLKKILDRENVEDPSIHSGLQKRVLVLGKPYVIQPPKHPLIIKASLQIWAICVLRKESDSFQ